MSASSEDLEVDLSDEEEIQVSIPEAKDQLLGLVNDDDAKLTSDEEEEEDDKVTRSRSRTRSISRSRSRSISSSRSRTPSPERRYISNRSTPYKRKRNDHNSDRRETTTVSLNGINNMLGDIMNISSAKASEMLSHQKMVDGCFDKQPGIVSMETSIVTPDMLALEANIRRDFPNGSLLLDILIKEHIHRIVGEKKKASQERFGNQARRYGNNSTAAPPPPPGKMIKFKNYESTKNYEATNEDQHQNQHHQNQNQHERPQDQQEQQPSIFSRVGHRGRGNFNRGGRGGTPSPQQRIQQVN